ncbi:MAG: hypothetical protein WA324_21480 [Bryobacteraceae bacterium]
MIGRHSQSESTTDTYTNAIHSSRLIQRIAEHGREFITLHFDAANVQIASTAEHIRSVDAAENWTRKDVRRLNFATGQYEIKSRLTRLIAYP